MYSRLHRTENENNSNSIKHEIFTASICTDIKSVLMETYIKDLQKFNYKLFVYGEAYHDELILIVSTINKDSELDCTSVIISVDQTKSKDKDDLDLCASLYSDILEDFIENSFKNIDFSSDWIEATKDNSKLAYKITRENVELSLKADNLLKQNK